MKAIVPSISGNQIRTVRAWCGCLCTFKDPPSRETPEPIRPGTLIEIISAQKEELRIMRDWASRWPWRWHASVSTQDRAGQPNKPWDDRRFAIGR